MPALAADPVRRKFVVIPRGRQLGRGTRWQGSNQHDSDRLPRRAEDPVKLG